MRIARLLLGRTGLVVSLAAVGCARGGGAPPGDSARSAPTDTAAVRRTVDSVAQSMTAAVLRNDMAGVVAGMAEDYVSLEAPGQIVRGRAAYRAGIDSMAKTGRWHDLVYMPEHFDVSGDLAVRSGRWRMTYVPARGDTLRADGNFMHIWRRQGDGSWRLAREISNSAAPLPALPSPGAQR